MSISEPETAFQVARRYLAESFRELWIRPAHQVYALDGLRALAILLVLCAHFFGDFWSNHVRETLPSMARWAPFYWGWTGVDLFFVLSGYLIGKQLWRERMETGTVRFVPFILRRGLRIWPLFFVILVYYTLFGPVHPKAWDYVFLTNFTRGKRGFDDAWSLSTEEQFYILVPFIIILSANIRWRWAYYVGIASTIGIEWGLRILVSHRLTGNGLTGKPLLDAMHYPIFLHCDGLLAGLAIALLSIQFPVRFRTRDRGNPSYLGIAIFVMASVIAILLRATSQIIFSFTSLGLIYGGLTLLMLWDGSALSAPARWRIWYPISRLSYGMYLNNYFILPGVTFVSFTVVRQVTGSTMLACMFGVLAGIATSMAVATLTFIVVERPFLILRDRLVHRRVHMHANAG